MSGKLEYNNIYFRALEPDDIDWLYQCENDIEIWKVSNTIVPFSRHTLRKYIETSHEEILKSGQARFVVCNKNNDKVGIADIFDLDLINKRAGIGILISSTSRRSGYALDSIELLKIYASEYLKIHQLYCNITSDNYASVNLFEKSGFEKTGNKKDWINDIKGFKNVFFYQYLFA